MRRRPPTDADADADAGPPGTAAGPPAAAVGASGVSGVHRVATVGNAVVAAVLMVLVSHDRLFVAGPPVPPPPGAADVRADRVLLVIIDGLRADTAADPSLMPNLCGLRRGGRGYTVRLDSLIPSTIAGITALATGGTSPPAAVFQDLRAFPAADGGVLAAARAAGGRCFVAGPPVWNDRFGRWIDGFHPLAHLVGSDDRPAAAAAADALASGQFRLVVAHFGGPDDAAHESGAHSPRYAAAAAAADAALGRLLAGVADTDLVIVTADHGNTAAGGHAGPEDGVIRVPLVVAGPGPSAGEAAVRRQAEIPGLIAGALGAAWPVLPPDVPPPARGWPAGPPLATAIACGCALWIFVGVADGRGSRAEPTLLNAAVWVALAATVAGWRSVAAYALATALVVSVVTSRCWLTPAFGLARLAAAAATAGAGLQAVRLWDGTGPTWVAGPLRDAALVAAVVVSYLGGRGLAARLRLSHEPRNGVFAGAALAVWVVLCGRLAGQTLSLSTLDVRAAYALAGSPVTVPLAVLVVVFYHAATVLGAVVGMRTGVRTTSAAAAGGLAAGAGAVLVGQLLVGSSVLWAATEVRPAALALGGLLRTAAEGIYLFTSLAALLVVGSRFSSASRRTVERNNAAICDSPTTAR